MSTAIDPFHFYGFDVTDHIINMSTKPGQRATMTLRFFQFVGEGAEAGAILRLQFSLMHVESVQFYGDNDYTPFYRIENMHVQFGPMDTASGAYELADICRTSLFVHANPRFLRLKEIVDAPQRQDYDAGKDAPYLVLVKTPGIRHDLVHKDGVLVMPCKDFSPARGIISKSSGRGVVLAGIASWSAVEGGRLNVKTLRINDYKWIIVRKWLFTAALWMHYAQRTCAHLPEYVRRYISEFLYPPEPATLLDVSRSCRGGFINDLASMMCSRIEPIPLECYRNTMEKNRLAIRSVDPMFYILSRMFN